VKKHFTNLQSSAAINFPPPRRNILCSTCDIQRIQWKFIFFPEFFSHCHLASSSGVGGPAGNRWRAAYESSHDILCIGKQVKAFAIKIPMRNPFSRPRRPIKRSLSMTDELFCRTICAANSLFRTVFMGKREEHFFIQSIKWQKSLFLSSSSSFFKWRLRLKRKLISSFAFLEKGKMQRSVFFKDWITLKREGKSLFEKGEKAHFLLPNDRKISRRRLFSGKRGREREKKSFFLIPCYFKRACILLQKYASIPLLTRRIPPLWGATKGAKLLVRLFRRGKNWRRGIQF